MRTFSFIVFLALSLLLPFKAVATPFSDGLAAYEKQDYQTALNLLLPLAEQGNPAAQQRVGMIYGNGWGVTADREKGVFWTYVPIKRGYHKNGLYPADAGAKDMPRNTLREIENRAQEWMPAPVENVKDWLEDASKENDTDKNFALNLYERLAEQGNAEAQIGAGWIAEDWKNWPAALKWFGRAADQGHPEGLKLQALHGISGVFSSLREKALNDPELARWLKTMYDDNTGPTAEYRAAVDCWQNICNADARKFIAGKDAEIHFNRLQRDAENGKDEARTALGYLYHYGLGVEKNAADALKLYKRSDGRFMYYHLVGELYYTGGVGLQQSYDEAYYWFYRANRFSFDKGMSPLVEKAAIHVGPVTKFLVYMKVDGWNHDSPAPYALVTVVGLLLIFFAGRNKEKHTILRRIFAFSFTCYAIFASMIAMIYIFPHSHSCWPECGFYSRLYYYYLGPAYGILLILVNWLFAYQLFSKKQTLLSRPLRLSNDKRVSEKRVWFVVLLLNVQTLGFLVATYMSIFLAG
jgi:TPR repeat protein